MRYFIILSLLFTIASCNKSFSELDKTDFSKLNLPKVYLLIDDGNVLEECHYGTILKGCKIVDSKVYSTLKESNAFKSVTEITRKNIYKNGYLIEVIVFEDKDLNLQAFGVLGDLYSMNEKITFRVFKDGTQVKQYEYSYTQPKSAIGMIIHKNENGNVVNITKKFIIDAKNDKVFN